MEFNKEDRPFGEKVERRAEELKRDAKDAGQKIQNKGHELKEEAKDRGRDVKEDLKGAARRAEGEVTGNEALKREHEPSMLEKAGEAISNAAEYVKETAIAGAEKIGLVSEGEHK